MSVIQALRDPRSQGARGLPRVPCHAVVQELLDDLRNLLGPGALWGLSAPGGWAGRANVGWWDLASVQALAHEVDGLLVGLDIPHLGLNKLPLGVKELLSSFKLMLLSSVEPSLLGQS